MTVGRRSRVLALVIAFGAGVLLTAQIFNVFDNVSVNTMYSHPYDTVSSWMMPKQRSSVQLTDMTNLIEDIKTNSPPLLSTSAHVTIDPVTTTPETVYSKRLKHLQQMCSKKSLIENQVYKKKSETVFLISKEYNFTYCKVPKTGCTFMTQTLAILKYGAENKDFILSKKRLSVHVDAKAFQVKFNSPERQQSRTVMITRNPFSRLLSAYLDKVYVPLFHGTFTSVQKLSGWGSKLTDPPKERSRKPSDMESSSDCSSSVNFEGFLRLVINQVRSGTITLDRHWCPISQLCHPCEMNTYFIIKQESYAEDLAYFLETLHIANETLDVIFEAMTGKRAVTSLPGILSVVYTGINNTKRRKSKLVRSCFGLEGYHRRIWSALQMQGFINEEIEFPVEDIRAHNQDAEAMKRIILDTVERQPMSSEAMKAQRRKALVNAFKDVSEETVDEIRDIYRQDFELFGYSMDVPTE